MLYRDDDINRFTNIQVFLQIHDLFIKYNKTHLCAIEMKDIWESRGIFHLLNTLPNIEIALHCWEHIDYSVLDYETARANIEHCLKYWHKYSASGYGRVKQIKIFCPTWNRHSVNLSKACFDNGLSVQDHKINTYNFHWWECLDKSALVKLEESLK